MSNEDEPTKRKVPFVVWDTLGVLFFLWVGLGTPAVFVATVAYVIYRVVRKLTRGSAYAERKPGQHRSFQITTKS